MELSKGEIKTKYKIIKVDGNNRRLFEFGFWIGTTLQVLCFSPKRQSMLICIGDGMVALRLDLASCVDVELV